MQSIIERTVRGLLESANPGPGFIEFGTLEHIAVQLYRLGKNAPRDLVERTRELVEQSYAMGAPECMLISVPALELLEGLLDLK